MPVSFDYTAGCLSAPPHHTIPQDPYKYSSVFQTYLLHSSAFTNKNMGKKMNPFGVMWPQQTFFLQTS